MYITLASNVANEGNKISNFRTNLARIISFEEGWVVGLTEITYTKSWYNVLQSIPITLIDEIGNVYKPTSKNIHEDFIIHAGYYDTPQKLVSEINKILLKFNQIIPPKIEYNELNNCVTVKAGKIEQTIKVYPNLGEELENILGLKNRNLKNDIYSTNITSNEDFLFKDYEIFNNDVLKAYHPVEISAGYQTLYLYSDIVYPSLIGDTCAPILRLIEIPRRYKFGDTVHINYDRPHYRSLLLNEFETIEMSLYDDSGKLVPFKFGRLAMTLHFKKL